MLNANHCLHAEGAGKKERVPGRTDWDVGGGKYVTDDALSLSVINRY